jgi:uncharacterized delta-60 repeat protein
MALGVALFSLAFFVAQTPPAANAATASTTVTANVLSATNLDSSGCATGASNVTAFGNLLPGSTTIMPSACVVGFGSSNDTGMLRLSQLDGAGSAMFLPPSGALDAGFGTAGVAVRSYGAANDLGQSLREQPDGKLVAVGSTVVAGNTDIAVMRLTTTGAFDTTFNGTGTVSTPVGAALDEAQDVVVQPDGKIVVVGRTDVGGANYDVVVLRYTSTGALDTTFNGTGKLVIARAGQDDLQAVTLQPDGSIVAVGSISGDFLAIRVLPGGTLDPAFGTAGIATAAPGPGADAAQAVLVQPDGKIVAVGQSSNGANNDMSIVRFTSAGALDTTFNTTGMRLQPVGSASDDATAVAQQDDGKLLVAGSSTNTTSDFAVVRLTTTGALDATFATGGKLVIPIGTGNDYARSLALQPDGRILVAGHGIVGANYDIAFARVTPAGVLDASYGTAGVKLIATSAQDDTVEDVDIASDGRYVTVGSTMSAGNGDFLFTRASTTTVNDYGVGGDWSAGTHAFGACLESAAGGAVGGGANGWTVAGAGNCTTALTANWNAIVPTSATAGAKVASTPTGTTTGVANLRFGLRIGTADPPGGYIAPILIEVLAPSA